MCYGDISNLEWCSGDVMLHRTLQISSPITTLQHALSLLHPPPPLPQLSPESSYTTTPPPLQIPPPSIYSPQLNTVVNIAKTIFNLRQSLPIHECSDLEYTTTLLTDLIELLETTTSSSSSGGSGSGGVVWYGGEFDISSEIDSISSSLDFYLTIHTILTLLHSGSGGSGSSYFIKLNLDNYDDEFDNGSVVDDDSGGSGSGSNGSGSSRIILNKDNLTTTALHTILQELDDLNRRALSSGRELHPLPSLLHTTTTTLINIKKFISDQNWKNAFTTMCDFMKQPIISSGFTGCPVEIRANIHHISSLHIYHILKKMWKSKCEYYQ